MFDEEISVREFIRIPFKEKGRDYDGVDCWGIPYLFYRDRLGIEVPSFSEKYYNTEDLKEIKRTINQEKEFWKYIPKDKKPQLYDIVIIRILNESVHCGMYIGNGKFIHCMSEIGVSTPEIASIEWRNRIIEYRRHPKFC